MMFGDGLRISIMGSNYASDRNTRDINDLWMMQTDEDGGSIEVEASVYLWEYWKTDDETEELAAHLGFRADDHDAVLTDATSRDRQLSSVSGAGIIEQIADQDWLRFTSNGGDARLSVQVPTFRVT